VRPTEPAVDNRATRTNDPFLGREIAGRYRIDRLIAKGGMGSVYQAQQVELGRKVAVKILHEPHDNGDPAAFEGRFLLEASALARLSHPHTVTLHDYGQTPQGSFYLVMEYIDGVPLSRLLKVEKRLAPDRCIRLMLQVTRALKHAHRHGTIHRDLKPGNLLIRQEEGEEVVKVVDFGLVKLKEGDQHITVTGMIMGSPHCMAPEQVEGGTIDERTDIYAMGILLFRCLTGTYPFHGKTAAATMIAQVNDAIPCVSEYLPALPDGLEEVVTRCLQKDPNDRYQSMNQLLRDLAASGEVSTEDFTPVSTIMEPQQQESRVPLLLGAAVALTLVGGTLYWLFAPTPQPTPIVQRLPVEVALRSTPSGAQVYSRDLFLGVTPLNVQLQAEGEHDERDFVFQLDGHVQAKVLRDVAGQEALEIEVDLAPEPVEEPITTPPDPVVKPLRHKPVAKAPAVETPPPVSEGATDDSPWATGGSSTETTEEPATPEGYKENPFD